MALTNGNPSAKLALIAIHCWHYHIYGHYLYTSNHVSKIDATKKKVTLHEKITIENPVLPGEQAVSKVVSNNLATIQRILKRESEITVDPVRRSDCNLPEFKDLYKPC